MSDNADKLRTYMTWVPFPYTDEAVAALDALVVERDEARRDYEAQREYADEQYRKALAAEAKLELRIEDDAVYRVYDEQVARAEAAEKERDEALERVKYMSDGGEAYRAEARKWAERERARAEAAEAERDTINREWGVCASRMVAAEAEVARLREELERIARDYDDSGEADIARAALAEDASCTGGGDCPATKEEA